MYKEEETHKSLNTYVFITAVEVGSEPEAIENVVSYEETSSTLTLTLALPKDNTTEYFIDWVNMAVNKVITIVRESEEDAPLFITDHHIVSSLGYSINGDINDKGITTLSVTFETAATLRVGNKGDI